MSPSTSRRVERRERSGEFHQSARHKLRSPASQFSANTAGSIQREGIVRLDAHAWMELLDSVSLLLRATVCQRRIAAIEMTASRCEVPLILPRSIRIQSGLPLGPPYPNFSFCHSELRRSSMKGTPPPEYGRRRFKSSIRLEMC